MKTTYFLISIFLSFLLGSCSRNSEISINEVTDLGKITKIQESGIRGIPFPDETKILKTNVDGYTKLILPEDVYFIVKNIKGEIYRLSEAGVRCTCSSGKGCSPVKHDGSYYCVMNENCSVCTMTITPTDSDAKIEILGLMDGRKPVKLYAKTAGTFTTTISQHQYGLSEDFFKSKEVINEINNLYDIIYGKNVPDFIKNNSTEIPVNYTFVKIDFFGNNILIPIPKNSSMVSDFNLKIIDPGDVSCKCHKGSGCTLKSMLGTKFCDAGNCSDCELKG